jgi:hypothetical protein
MRSSVIFISSLVGLLNLSAAPVARAAAQSGGCTLPAMQLHHALATVGDLPLARRDNYTFQADDPLPREMRSRLARVGDVIRSAPALSARGGDLRIQPTIASGWDKTFPWKWPTDSGPYFGFYSLAWFGPRAWSPDACAARKGASSGGGLLMVANAGGPVNAALTSASFTDGAGEMFIEPRITRRISGFPVYEDRVLIVTNSSRPILVPASVERVLEAQAADLRKMLASTREEQSVRESGSGSAAMSDAIKQLEALYEQMRETNPKGAEELKGNIEKMRKTAAPAVRDVEGRIADTLRASSGRNSERLRRLEAHIASLSSAERAAQAYVGGKSQDEWGLGHAGDEGAYALVSFNRAYFDRAAPRGAIQLLALIPRSGTDEALTKLGWELLESLDYDALRALMTR